MSHPTSFDKGRKCCSGIKDCNFNYIERPLSKCCQNEEEIDCPSGFCEDCKQSCSSTTSYWLFLSKSRFFSDRSTCINWNLALTDANYQETVIAEGFEDSSYNGEYSIDLTVLENAIFIHNRPVFQKDDKCIW